MFALVDRIGKSDSEALTLRGLLHKLWLNPILVPLSKGTWLEWLKKEPQTERAIDVESGESR